MQTVNNTAILLIHQHFITSMDDLNPGGGALQYEMDIGVRLRLPNPGAFGDSERREKKSGASGEKEQVKMSQNYQNFS